MMIAMSDDAPRVTELDREELKALARLREALKVGLDSGDAGELDWEALKVEGRRQLER